jgi:cytochrome c-type biogenesis protein CcmH
MTFWIIVAAMLAAALAFVLLPLLRQTRATGPAEDDINIEVYRQRLTELEAELKSDVLTQEQHQRARAELERQMAADLAPVASASAVPARSPAARWTAVAVGVAVPVLAVGLYVKLGNLQAPSRPAAAASAGQAAQAEMHNFEEAVDRLAAKLATDPKNGEGWAMLGRSYVMLKRYGEAGLAFSKAVELLGNEPDVLADYAEALALANNDSMQGQPAQLVARALKANPNHAKSLWLSGHALLQQGRAAQAIEQWRRLVNLLPPGNEGRAAVEQMIAQVQSSNPQLAGAAGAPPPAAASKGATMQVRVELARELAARAAPTDTVFVFARAAQGPRMPLAIVRKQVKDLPVTVTLDDSMAMSPEMKLSSTAQVVVGARVSKAGTAMPQSGDLEGLSAPLPPHTSRTVLVTIGSVVP